MMVPSQTGKKAEKAAAAAIVSHPVLSPGATRFMELEREVEQAYRPQMLQALEEKVQAETVTIASQAPQCPHCGQAMKYHDRPKVSWIVRYGRLRTAATRYRCAPCHYECRPLLDHLGVEAGRISGSLARLLVLLTVIAPYELAARLACLLLGV
jgi:DNA-directed RNA polymerase subunit RPC12/RpoP